MTAPLAERMRPRQLDDVLGQAAWLAPGAPLRRAIDAGRPFSAIFCGPPGCGKTTTARLVAAAAGLPFATLSATSDGVKELRELLAGAERRRAMDPRALVLFVDEIHRWNKAQQDALLPHVEAGDVVLLGATTENPSFTVNAALRSRLRVVRLEPLSDEALTTLLQRALTAPEGLGRPDLRVDDAVLARLAQGAAGDARRALTDLERVVEALDPGAALTLPHAAAVLQRADLRHDRAGDDHYDVLSAFIKSMRGSDPDAAVYWLARLLEGGEDPVAVARRLVIFAAEDVGNADPRGLTVATAAADAARHVGMPEVRIPLAQAAIWLACAPKSNASYLAINAALEDVRSRGALPVPPHLRSHPPPGATYRYPHDAPHRVVDQAHLPDALTGRRYYDPPDLGDEKTIRARLAWWRDKLR